jgi:hypothetical protein
MRFYLAPMSTTIRILTGVLLALPFIVVLTAGAETGTFVALWIVALLYVGVWLLMRPGAFELGPDGLSLLFPARRKEISRRNLAGARVMDKAGFEAEFGWGVRVGSGGLWGGFGWLWTKKQEKWVEFYVSRTDRFALVELRRGMPLLLTPGDPDKFVMEFSRLYRDTPAEDSFPKRSAARVPR